MVMSHMIDFTTIDSGWKDLTPTRGTWVKLGYRVVGKLCYIYGWASSVSTENGQLTTLPPEIRSQSQNEIHFWATGVNAKHGKIIIYSNDGSVYINAFTSDSVGYMTFYGSYFID